MSSPEERPSLAKIGERARTAVGWRALGQFSNQGIQIVTTIVLARLLMPDDFGIVGMAAIVTGLAAVFRDLGFGQALVQRAELREEHKRSAFWVTLVMAGLLYGGIYLAASYAGQYFHDERMVPVLRIMALSFLLTPLAVVPRSLLQRELDFKRPFFADLAGTITYGAVGITSAVLGHGYWSLVWALLASSAVGTVAVCIIVRYRPPLIPSLRGARSLLAFGIGVTGSGLLGYVSTRVDYLIIGRRLDAAALGLYKRAYDLVDYPVSLTSRLVYPVLFPSYSRLQHDLPRLRKALGRSLALVSIVSYPALALLAASAPELIPGVLGSQWRQAVVPTQIMAAAGLLATLGGPGGAAIRAVGWVYAEVKLQAMRAVLLLAGSYIGSRWGIEGVACGVLAARVLNFPLYAWLLNSSTGLSVRDIWSSVRGAVLMGGLALAFASGVRAWLHASGCSDILVLVCTLAAGSCAALLSLIWCPFPETRTARREMGDLVHRGLRLRR